MNNPPPTSTPAGPPWSPEPSACFGYQRVSPEDKIRLVQRHFDTVARRYDLMNTLLSFGLHHVWKRGGVRMLDLRPGDRVLDVCGGTGDLALLAARAVGPPGRVVLYDFNRAMMAAGRPKIAASGWRHLELVQGDAQRLSCPDAVFDAAMVGFGIRNVLDMDAGLKEMHRVLKPGGKLMILEFSRPTWGWFRRLYDFYSFAVMPLAGQIAVGSRRAYTYLPESIRLFPGPAELAAILENIGFSGVFFHRLTNGIAVIHLGVKI
jgi:demethylmenaquinone methyltransferase / 2-methoxy-6-polyprenyl-1,4-benzoquinol methylase